ncbi:MAG: Ig-like domain-containing protein, partial [Candidatus Hadarchaeota archaeon]|nr:Ig-like domain-containing protein [Candidatus Hadarchaeota archaeon]
ENSDGLRENILEVTMSTIDNIEFTGEFAVGYWDDNTPEIEVAGCEDAVGNENEESPEHSFRVDTRPPIFLDNGLPGALTNYTQVVDNWIATENDVWVITGRVLENGGSDFSVYVDSVLASIDPTDNSFSGTLDLGSDGLKTVTVRAVDVLGNENSENVENILLDTTEPTIDLEKLAGETFENNMWIKDNMPAMELAILDPGYPDTGLGVDYANITVELYSAAGVLITAIENSNAWDPLDGSYDNDGITDGAGGALAGAQYYIGVWASDNFPGRWANENFWFRIDVIPPDIDDLIAATDVIDPETGLAMWSGATTKQDSLDIVGTADEPGSTVHIYVDSTEKTVESDETDRGFSTTIDLSEGINKIYVKEVDVAGNESEKKLLASITADWTPPDVTITEPTTDTSTDEVSITVSGKVTDTVADYDELVVQLDATGAYVLKTIYLNPDGSFSTTVPLTEGTNIITVYARDQAGNQDLFSVTVDRSVTSWYLYFMIVAIVIVILAAIAVLRK